MNLAGIIAQTAIAADRIDGGCAFVGKASANRKTAMAAAAANRLRQNAIRERTRGVNGAVADNIDGARSAAGSAIATDTAVGLGAGGRWNGLIIGGRQDDRNTAIAATATDRLGEYARGIAFRGGDVAGAEDFYSTAGVARAAIAARTGHKGEAARRNADGTTDTAIATRPADRLRQNAIRTQAIRIDIAVIADMNEAASCASAAFAANRHAERPGKSGINRQCPRNRQATIAAAAAQRLRENAVGLVVMGGNRAGGIDLDCLTDAAASSLAAKGQGERGVLRPCSRNCQAAIAAAAANRLRKNAVRAQAEGLDAGSTCGIVDSDIAGVAPTRPIAAKCQTERAVDCTTYRCGKPTAATTATH